MASKYQPISYRSPSRDRVGLVASLGYTALLIVILPVAIPIAFTTMLGDGHPVAAATAFFGGGDLALSSVFLVAAMLCEAVIQKKPTGVETVLTILVALFATISYAEARIKFQPQNVWEHPSLLWISLGCYLVASILTFSLQIKEARQS